MRPWFNYIRLEDMNLSYLLNSSGLSYRPVAKLNCEHNSI